MSLSALPLPLELAQPIHLAGDLDGIFRAGLRIGTYDPKIQMGPPSGGYCDTSSESSAESNTTDVTGFLVIDAQTDFALADDLIQDFQNTGVYDTDSESEAESNTTDTTGFVVIDVQTDAAALDDIIQDFQNG